jgi:hypothetical protein
MTAEKIKQLAEELVDRLKEDIHKAGNRESHVRASARANEADLLLQGLNQMFDSSTLQDDDNSNSNDNLQEN